MGGMGMGDVKLCAAIGAWSTDSATYARWSDDIVGA